MLKAERPLSHYLGVEGGRSDTYKANLAGIHVSFVAVDSTASEDP